jgi:uncharacterized protein
MKLPILSFGLLMLASLTVFAAEAPLRVFIRGGVKSHAPGAHEHAQFLKDWQPILTDRGMTVDGGMDLPSDEQLKQTDVLLMYAQDGGTVPPSRWASLDEYLKRGGGLVVVHTAAVSLQEDHWKAIIGGCWRKNTTKWKEGPMDLYYVQNQRLDGGHPITKNASNFHLDDEIYYDMDLSPDVNVLATSYTPNVRDGRKPAEGNKAHIYDIQPQMWTYERTLEGGATPYRAFVSIPGHLYKTFSLPHYRAVLMRGIAWAGKRTNMDEFCKPEELSGLTYPDGGPQKPADTLKNLEIHPDFNLTLVAAEPLITKPMNFDWAPDGSMWVAETPEYPNGRRGMRPDYRGKEWKDHGGIDPRPGQQDRPGLDKISRLIDTDKDGVMDKKEVFYEGLDLVTGLVFYKDGVIVTQAPDILWLRDTDKDGKADKVEKLYGNLGTNDTHAVINNPRWGWDGWIYATHGYSSSDNVVNAKGEKQDNIGSGVVRFKADGSKIEQYSSKGGNTWGLQVTDDNRVMWTQPTSGTILEQVVLPEYALARGKWGNTPSFNVVIGSPKSHPLLSPEQLAYVQIDFVGSFTATAGCAIYDGGSWPAEYNGDYFTTEPTINIIHHERLTPKGSSYTGNKLPGREDTEFIRSKDMWWRPIEARVGPDGAIYIGDFYNQAVIHNDTRGPDHNAVNAAVRPDRDHYFGRIWRLDHKQAKKLDVPDLSKAGPGELVKALDHPNRVVRMTASRLLVELSDVGKPSADFGALGLENTTDSNSRIAGMWTAFRAKPEDVNQTYSLLTVKNGDAAVRRNAAQICEAANLGSINKWQPLLHWVKDEDPSVRIVALNAIATSGDNPSSAAVIVAAWSKFDDDFQKSAAVGALAQNSAAAIAAILDTGDASLAQLASILTQSIGDKNDPAAAAQLVIALGEKPASADGLKRSILDTLGKSLKAAPDMTPELSASLTKLLTSGASSSVLPLAAQWDKAGALKDAIASLTKDLFTKLQLSSAADDERFTAAQSLIGLRSANAASMPAVLGAITGNASPALQTRLINALGETGDTAVGTALAAAYSKLPAEVQPVAFSALVKRGEWALALLDSVKAKTIDPAVLGPANIFRLRTHPDKSVAKRTNEMMDELMPGAKAKSEVIAKLAPEMDKKADIEMGKLLFTATCATCHKFGGAGAEVGPNLTGMGAHGAGELLAAIADPNAEVDPSFTAWNIETKDGQFFAGVIARENPSSIFIRFQGGEKEIRTADIKTRVNTARSLMPEGFDGLGPEVLRNIIAYMQEADGGKKFRTLDLRPNFTATTALGLYESQEKKEQTLTFKKTGTVMVENVPFNIVAPEKAPQNVIVLKGGSGDAYCSTLPQKTDIKVGGFKANRLHILGGVTGWGWQPGGEKMDVLKITIHTTQGQREAIVCQSGVEFADYYNRWDVPGSKFVPGLVEAHQVRWFSKQFNLGAVEIERITMESVPSGGAPTIVAITAELAEPGAPSPGVLTPDAAPAPAPAPKVSAAEAPQEWGQGTRVLLAGGGSSHDFKKFFNEADTAILKAGGFAVQYTENFQTAADKLAEADVLVFSTNQGSFANVAFRAALDQFAAQGKGIVLLHAGMWYNFPGWPEFNKVYAGGGSRGHDNLSKPFGVTVKQPTHPIMKDVPATFTLTDELYYMIPDPAGSPIEVLAEATSVHSGKVFPSVFTVKHDKARIAGIALGHDARAHDLPAFQTILKNAATWAAGK